jgi:hypothetical protein
MQIRRWLFEPDPHQGAGAGEEENYGNGVLNLSNVGNGYGCGLHGYLDRADGEGCGCTGCDNQPAVYANSSSVYTWRLEVEAT